MADRFGCRCEPSDHDVYHRHIDHRLAGFGSIFVVLTQSSLVAKPGKSPFDNPSSGQDLESRRCAMNNFENPMANAFDPFDQLATVTTIGPDQLQPRQPPLQMGQQQFRSVPILDAANMNNHAEHQPQRINNQMSLRAVLQNYRLRPSSFLIGRRPQLLPRIVASRSAG